jgi:thiamine phosphate synthase YjbQ (UPF0047 family)
MQRKDILAFGSILWIEGSFMATIKAHTEYLTFHTEARYEMVHITPQVEEIVRRSGIEDGSPMHITAAIYVNDNENGLIEDIGTWLEKLAPAWPGYKHGGRQCRCAFEGAAAAS